MCTQCVLSVYSVYTQCVLSVYSVCTQCVLSVYSVCTQCGVHCSWPVTWWRQYKLERQSSYSQDQDGMLDVTLNEILQALQ